MVISLRATVRLGVAGCAALAALLPVGALHAESVDIAAELPANFREASYLRRIEMRGITGRGGRRLEEAITRAMDAPRAYGERPFTVMTRPYSPNPPDGVLSGAMSRDVDRTRYKKTVERCAEREDGDCVRHEKTKVRCTRRVVTLRVHLRITRVSDDAPVYSTEKPVHDEVRWCAKDRKPPSAREVTQGLIDEIAAQVREDLVPHNEFYSIRFLETRKGMRDDMERPFKDAVKLTKHDLPAACRAWQAMNRDMPPHGSVLFDLGLCSEAAGDYETALAYYRQSRQVFGGKHEARDGIERVYRLIAAREDAEVRRSAPPL